MRTSALLFFLLFANLAARAQFQGALFDSLSADYDAGQFEKCIKSRQSVLLAYEAAQDSTTADVYYMIGSSYLNLGETDSARMLFEKESAIRKKSSA